MPESIAVELIKLIPSILWLLFVVIILILFYRPIRNDLLPNLSAFKAGGIELSFVKESMNAALELAEKSPQWKVHVSSEERERVLRRAKQHLKIFEDTQILWVDDHPENNLNERRMFCRLHADIDIAQNTEDALEMVKSGKYNLIISDMARNSDATAGLDFIKRFRMKDLMTPVIFYVGILDHSKGIPSMAFGITNRPDELLHLTIDALERQRY